MKNLAVVIIDLDKIDGSLFKDLWMKEQALYVAKIKEESYQKVTDSVDAIQELELLK